MTPQDKKERRQIALDKQATRYIDYRAINTDTVGDEIDTDDNDDTDFDYFDFSFDNYLNRI